DAPWASPATVPSAYLHPRFQGQEPPGFPGRFNNHTTAVRAITTLPIRATVGEVFTGAFDLPDRTRTKREAS
ncbi:hypothetical protein AAHS21_16725, partial [Mycobacterium sp. 050272]|uniref:hypothetical protein n=1 Tax=Mycobacterium sp. 050272 TaxID=3142488 RepID=UPI0031991175